MSRKKKYVPVFIRITFVFFIFIFLLYHLSTLAYNPLPWFDETYFVSITLDFMLNGTFVPLIARYAREGAEALTYGPIYFYLTSLSFKTFGFGIFQFRLVAFLFGVLSVTVSSFILIKAEGERKQLSQAAILLALVFLLDPFFNLSMHEGRMDTTAVFLCLISFWLIMGENKSILVFFSGFAGNLAMLTTPRVSVILVGIFMALLFHLKAKKDIKLIFFWLLPFLIFYPVWIYYAFGGIQGWISYYLGKFDGVHAANHAYLGGRFYIPRHETLLVLCSAIAFLYGIVKRGKSYFNKIIIASVFSIVLFYFLVLDWGPYSVYIIPFHYLIIFNSLAISPLNFRNPVLYLCGMLLFFNFTYASLKAAQILTDMNKRNPELADRFIKANIPPGSRVAGSGLFYYSVIKAGSDLQLYDKYDTLESREQKLRTKYDYDFLIVAEIEKHSNAVQYFMEQAEFEKIGELKTKPSPEAQVFARMQILSGRDDAGYNAEIYKKIR